MDVDPERLGTFWPGIVQQPQNAYRDDKQNHNPVERNGARFIALCAHQRIRRPSAISAHSLVLAKLYGNGRWDSLTCLSLCTKKVFPARGQLMALCVRSIVTRTRCT